MTKCRKCGANRWMVTYRKTLLTLECVVCQKDKIVISPVFEFRRV